MEIYQEKVKVKVKVKLKLRLFLCLTNITPWNALGSGYIQIYALLISAREGCDQLRNPANLLPGKELPLTIGQDAGWPLGLFNTAADLFVFHIFL
jgi:hypothetical protein